MDMITKMQILSLVVCGMNVVMEYAKPIGNKFSFIFSVLLFAGSFYFFITG